MAAEFAVLFPALVSTLLGIIWASLLTYSAASLHYAVEGAARCYSVESQCSSASAAQSYAQNRDYGANVPTFTASTPSCGHRVSATVNVAFSLALANWKIPLNATACFPWGRGTVPRRLPRRTQFGRPPGKFPRALVARLPSSTDAAAVNGRLRIPSPNLP